MKFYTIRENREVVSPGRLVWPEPGSRDFDLPAQVETALDGLLARVFPPTPWGEELSFSVDRDHLLILCLRRPHLFLEARYHRNNNPSIHFHQRIGLPPGLEPAGVQARFRVNVLEIRIPFMLEIQTLVGAAIASRVQAGAWGGG